MLDDGDPAPDFDLPRPSTDGAATYRLSAAAREGPVVVAFFPASEQSSGTDRRPASALLGDLASVDWGSVTDRLSIYGIGVGTPAAVAGLADELDLPFPLLADAGGYFASEYGVLTERGQEAHVRRGLVLVDRNCRIRFVWRAEDPDETPPIDDLTSSLATL